MNIIRWVCRVKYCYTKDGTGLLLGKLLATILMVIALVDSILGTYYLGLTILFGVIFIFLFGTPALKVLDKLNIIDLSPEAEVLRKGFGLITGIDDWFEMVISSIFD